MHTPTIRRPLRNPCPRPAARSRLARALAGSLSPSLFPTSLLLLSLLSAPLAASAAEIQKTAVVLDPKVDGPIIPQDLAAIDQAVSAALVDQRFLLAAKGERDAMLSGENIKGCYRNDCMERIGRLLGGHIVLAYKIKVQLDETVLAQPQQTAPASDGKRGRKGGAEVQQAPAADTSPLNWQLSAVLYDIEVGAIGARVESKCDHCSGPRVAKEATDMIQRAVIEDASKPRGQIEISSEPSNSSVIFDGVELGVTPYRHTTFVGEHKITVRHTGRKSVNQSVTISDLQKSAVSLQLEPGNDPGRYIKEYQPRPKWRLAVGGALIGAGIIGLGIGAYGLAIDGNCIDDPVSPVMVCPQVRSGKPAGLGFLVGGGVVAVAGAVMMLVPGQRNPLVPAEGTDSFGDKAGTSDKAGPRAGLLLRDVQIGASSSGATIGLVGTY